MTTVVHLCGPINAGKSTLGAALAARLADAVFIDGDDHDAPDDAPLAVRIAAALARIEAQIATTRACHLVVAYPLDAAEHRRLRAVAAARGARFLTVALAPPLAVALTDRGARRLSERERRRILEMYADGHAAPAFADLVVDTAAMPPETCVERILGALGLDSGRDASHARGLCSDAETRYEAGKSLGEDPWTSSRR
ncbi:shikimate kinase [Siculibacillus lacustris]|uniref:shikimate kinase n=1 Tax=Siculibacillus lacustris TaxID=1549641 RepID=UPI0019CFA6B3|nr:shikimate kinase [Siculibacillus lacustris]